jgi:hypothetical protein
MDRDVLPFPRPESCIPLALGAVALALLAAMYVAPPVFRREAPWPVFAKHVSGCLNGARTQHHAGGRSLGEGAYQPCLVDTGQPSGEPGLAIAPDGTLIRSVALNPTGILVSADQGRTWLRRALPAGTRDGIPDGYIDPVTGRYFYSALGNSPVYASDDKGQSWQAGQFDSAVRYDWNKVFSGRPVKAREGGYPTNIYYCNMTQPGGFLTGTRCFRSTDGGRTFVTSGADPYRRGDCTDYTQPQGSGVARGVVDPRDGTIYLSTSFCGAIEVAVSRDEGTTWTRRRVQAQSGSGGTALIAALGSAAWRNQLLHRRKNIVPIEMAANQSSDAIGIDGRGRLYLIWLDDQFQLVIATSPDQAQTWAAPQRIGLPGLAQTALPSLAVAADGKLGVAYYGTADGQVWTGYMGIGTLSADGKSAFETAAITRANAPLMPEPCCWASGANEYTAARWAPDGSLWGAFLATTATGPARGIMGRLRPLAGGRP